MCGTFAYVMLKYIYLYTYIDLHCCLFFQSHHLFTQCSGFLTIYFSSIFFRTMQILGLFTPRDSTNRLHLTWKSVTILKLYQTFGICFTIQKLTDCSILIRKLWNGRGNLQDILINMKEPNRYGKHLFIGMICICVYCFVFFLSQAFV